MKREEPVKFALALITLMLLFGILSGLLITNVRSIYQTSSTISSVGTFKAIGIGAYWDTELTLSVDLLDWGVLTPGIQKSFTFYIANEGNLPLTLSISTSNWNPQISSDYLIVTWSYLGQTISPGKTIPVTLTLTVSGNINGFNNFSFDIAIAGTSIE